MCEPFDLTGKNIIITGASSGIGRTCAIETDKRGASLFLFGRDESRLKETLNSTKYKARHKIYTSDLTVFEHTEELFSAFKKEGFIFNGLIHSAGISATVPLRRTDPEKIRNYVDINVISAIQLAGFLCDKQFLSPDGASMVLIASVMGLTGEIGKTLYSLTKGALISAARSMAIELAAKNIRVNCVCPGVVDTPMSKNAVYSRDEEALEKIRKLHPLGIGRPEDVAYACIYLLSDAARWVTGTNLVVDGGYTAR